MTALNEVVAWSQPAVDTSPAPRNGHSFTVLSGKIVLFGGIVRGVGSCNDMHVLDVSQGPQAWRWTQPTVTGDIPSDRSHHTATVINDKEILVFGGQVCRTTLQVFNDVHVLTAGSDKWEWRKIVTSGVAPTARGRHTATLYNNKLYVFGGYGQANNVFGDLCCYDIETNIWSKPKPKGTAPKPRFAHSAALAGNRLFLFGGTGEHNTPLADCAILNLDTMEWAEPDQVQSPQQLCKHQSLGVSSALAEKNFCVCRSNTTTIFH